MVFTSGRNGKGTPGLWTRFAALFLLALALVPTSAFSQGEIVSISIMKVDTSQFPLVRLHVATRTASGTPAGLSSETNMRVLEDGAERSIEGVETIEEGIRVAFVVDPGDGVLNTGMHFKDVYSIANDKIMNFVSGRPWMQAGVDEVTVLIQGGGETSLLVPMTSDPVTIGEGLKAYVPPSDTGFERAPEYGAYTREGIKSGLDELQFTPEGEARQKALVLITPGIRADLADIAQRAVSGGIPIYVISARQEASPYWEDALRPLASVTHGEFLGSYADSVEPMFERITAHRTQNLITFHSSSAATGNRQVTLEVNSGSQIWSANAQYQVALQPPLVEIVSPPPGAVISRTMTDETPSSDQAEPTYTMVAAQISWPDGHPRAIRQATLLVDGKAVSQTQVNQGMVEFAWDIHAFQSPSPVPALIQVLVDDEIGIRGESAPFTVAVENLGVTGNHRSTGLGPVYVLTGISLIALAVSTFLFINRAKVSPLLQHAGESIVDFVDRVTGRRTELVPRAFLVPLEGLDARPMKTYEIYGTTSIGRSRRHADLLFHISDDDSPISRLHCTILDEDDHFAIRDEDSTNGTLVNNERIKALEVYPLRDGDILDIAPLERGGIRFLFQVAGIDGAPPNLEERIRQTRPRRIGDQPDPRPLSQAERVDRWR